MLGLAFFIFIVVLPALVIPVAYTAFCDYLYAQRHNGEKSDGNAGCGVALLLALTWFIGMSIVGFVVFGGG